MKRFRIFFSEYSSLLFYLSFYFTILIYKLIINPLPFYDWDEAIYAQVGREMIENKSLIPLWQGKYWLDKPPLVMLIYGIVAKIFSFVKPEISMRLFNLFLNILLLIILYKFILKILQSKKAAFISVLLTSFTPLFIQRAHTVNMDVFLALGWVGYFYFYPNFWLSTFFLTFAVFSKSLLGFYPLIVMFLIEFLKNNLKLNLRGDIKKIFFQSIIFSFWYLYMIFRFGNDFIFQHFYESHIKRVSASIEFHFGEKIFYFLEIYRQFNWFIIPSFLGLVLIGCLFFKKRIKLEDFINLNLFLPWFIFLNLTKTKIFWYVYPVIPQFSLYPGFLYKFLEEKIENIWIKKLFFILIIVLLLQFGILKNNLLTVSFSSEDKFYQLAKFSNNNCRKIYFLPEKTHRKAIEELERMGLTITTTKWWGGHPSLVYYTDNKVEFIYDEKSFFNNIKIKKKSDCISFFKDDIALNQKEFKVKLINNFEEIWLFK